LETVACLDSTLLAWILKSRTTQFTESIYIVFVLYLMRPCNTH
jgi:hypothetical protein